MVTVTEPKPPAAGGGAEAGAEFAGPLGLGGVEAGGSMVTDTDGGDALAVLASAGGVAGAAGGAEVDSAEADVETSVGMAAPHLMQNLVDCCDSNPQATHLREAMMNF